MPNLKFQKIVVWRKFPQKKWRIRWICSNPDLKNILIWMVGIRNNFIRFRVAIYLDGFQRRISKLRSSLDVSRSGTSINERTGWIYMENIAYNFTLTYGTCEGFGSVYSICINVYHRSYFSVSTNQRYDKWGRRSDHAI